MITIDLGALDWVSLAWFASCWGGYTLYSGFSSGRKQRLQDALYAHIKDWIDVLHERDMRMVDTSVIANIERSATFLASSSLLIIAGLVTAIGSSDKVIGILSDFPLTQQASRHTWELGLLLLILIFAYAFFTFTWCMRQWGFASILVGSANLVTVTTEAQSKRRHAETMASVVWLAIYQFNLGLRAYYFSLALLTWFIHPIVFMFCSAWVVAVLYRREFRSRTLQALLAGLD
jgi:uncharacterized membrane protein